MKKLFVSFLAFVASLAASANDSGYATNGNMLIPFVNTDISVDKEVLTIRLADDGKTYIDVDYTFINHGSEKTILMGFEADSPYPGGEISSKGHPQIYNFSVMMNGASLTPKTSIVLLDENRKITDRTPIDISKWEAWDMGMIVQKQYKDDDGTHAKGYAYVYSFNAKFKAGENHIRHTYNYENGSGVMSNYFLSYKLTPAARWAGGSIRDFTLRISAPNTAKHFFLTTEFAQQKPTIVEGAAKYRPKTVVQKGDFDGEAERVCKLMEISMRNATLEWHLNNYSPKEELDIVSADNLYGSGYSDKEREKLTNSLTYYYDRSGGVYHLHYAEEEWSAAQRRLVRNLPYANRGYVFKDAGLRKHFESLWWYMPDPSYVPKQSDFSKDEWEMIMKNK